MCGASSGSGQAAPPFTLSAEVATPRERTGEHMELQIRSNGTKVTDGMREFIDRRMSKLDHLAERVVDAQLDLRTEHPRAGAPQTTAQLTLKTGQHLIRAEVRADDPAKAIDAAIDKLIRTVHKYNDKRQSRRRRAGEHPMNELVDVGELDLPDLLAEDDRDTGPVSYTHLRA